ncbi:polymerase [Rubrobacter tropicus]|uniref:Polymerase n=1 Tax=Rubrobacter tropicus TaxID=2653851 RepID=A0A6G8QD19_9ACTN|nr:O-antigen ligase family protein [Rubrobacter tropicus]QIN84379.1 polymerase [Rubrobacter tropicus]
MFGIGIVEPRGSSNRLLAAFRRSTQASKNQERLYPTVALVVTVLLAAWMGDANGGYFVGNWAPCAFVVATVAFLVAAVAPFGGARLRWGVLALALFVAYTAWTLASVLWSPNKGDAWLGAGQTYLYLLVFLTTVALVALGASRRWVLAASVLGPAAVAALTLLALPSRTDASFFNDRLVGTVGYYNGEAAFLLVSLWVAVYLGGSRRVNPVLRGAVLAGAVLGLNLAVLTQSRGAMVALAASLPVYFLLSGQRLRGLLALAPVAGVLYLAFPGLNAVYVVSSNGGSTPAALDAALPAVWLGAAGVGLYGLIWGLIDVRWRPPAAAKRVVGGLVLAGCLVALTVGATVFVERFGEPVSVAEQKWEAFRTNDTAGEDQSRYLSISGTGRYTLWQVAWEDFSGRPVLGVGTQNWEATYYQERERASGFARQPHSLPLEVLAERGIVGGVLFFGFLGVCVVAGLWQRFKNFHSEGKAQVGALTAAVAYWFVHSGAEWFWQIPAVTLPAIVYLAMLVAPWKLELAPHPLRWPLRAGGVGIAALAVLVVAPLYAADVQLSRSYAAGSLETKLAAVQRAQEYDPLDSRLPQREAELASRMGAAEGAEDAYGRAIDLNPRHYAPYVLAARFYEKRGREDKAREYYQEAAARNPFDDDLKRHVGRRVDGGSVGGESVVDN